MSNANVLRAIPVLEVTDVERSMLWYGSLLGFSADPFPQSPPHHFAILRHGLTELMLRRGNSAAPRVPKPYVWNVYLRMGGGQLRRRFAELTEQGVVTRRLERMFYGLAEFEITDPDGYVLCLSEELDECADLPTPAQ